ncbi:probable serine/threonine-protein kinase DDB_G0282963 [Episyrphus balteatus]|uniref:probable serine/threonine-protein kinase DDB_G0282963 n=1 Tax=Episyrphus balteatus TaxID=286459 RepID=UPI0024859D9C|nr:probable serine/threonine-protein kinase DDB_G0282963 [Episyrphus balteatus]XP_055843723.1 probable serine/threonine-protein kinase DDB_G0282963 [Episyrphus balteatus]XP_055843724.1 probable serine/threonine-protein kinase DDB_G0282963 [Episyrphus balteatus]XP_055843725.1 probable serine/threonine-protein kinase DDB_G0282963 [Episyrphus balteatus]XP_055843726.1 probable serine/threonine-protein kinase DDB_G0282963 [Episyrphus balteatus]XP_055843727.1 probable serine/threonine-protein kinase
MATLSQNYDTNYFDVNPYYVPINNKQSPMYDKSKKTWSQRLKISKTDKATAQMVVPQLPPPPSQMQQHQLHHEFPVVGGLDFPPSALSRSMKYAEPWIYGTVRGIPARPMHFHPGQAMFAPMPSEIAVVICSCPEYLNGTKREVKKASICKKCKGSRLPLAPIGGTVRIRPTSTPIQQKHRPTNASTMRVVSSKSRPSILDPQKDPYDLMRRTRLLSPEPKSSPQQSDKNYRSSRGKSSSPNRSRSRTPRSQLEEPAKSSPKQTQSSSSKTTDRWIVEDSSQSSRRSILRCNVNPYDLISNKSSASSSSSSVQHLSEFSPHDDEDDDVVTDMFGGKSSSSINQKTTISRKTTGPLNISSPSPSPSAVSSSAGTSSGGGSSNKPTMSYANCKAIAGQRISFGEHSPAPSLITKNGESFLYENVVLSSSNNNETTSNSPKFQKQQQHSAKKDDSTTSTPQPKRPPRRKNDVNLSSQQMFDNPDGGRDGDDGDDCDEDDGDGTGTGIASSNRQQQRHHHQIMSSQISTDLVVGVTGTGAGAGTVAASQRPSIKSILKRPLSSPTSGVLLAVNTPSKSPLNGDTDTGSLVGSSAITTNTTTSDSCRLDQQQQFQQQQQQHNQHHHHHQIKRNSTRTHESSLKSPSNGSSSGTGVGNGGGSSGGGNGTSGNSVGLDTMLAKSNGGQKTAAETKTGSQFYIPLPQARKKVQFMVEDKIIQVDNANYHHHHHGDRDENEDEDEDDDEDDYHSAQGDETDKTEISKQIGKTLTANYRNCSSTPGTPVPSGTKATSINVGAGGSGGGGGNISKSDTTRKLLLSSKPTLVVTDVDKDQQQQQQHQQQLQNENKEKKKDERSSSGSGDGKRRIIAITNGSREDFVGKENPTAAPVAMANRFNQELLQRQRQQKQLQQQQRQQQKQEAVLNLLQLESNLVSSELLNSGKNTSYYQNFQQQQRNQNQSQDQNEPHYEDVANDDDGVNDANDHDDDDNDTDNDDDEEKTMSSTSSSSVTLAPTQGSSDEDPCGRFNGNGDRTKDLSSCNLKTSTPSPPEDEDEETASVTTPTSSQQQPALSRNAIRRTHSERHPCNVHIGTSSTNVILNFKDTMALRVKATRKDSRDIFSSSSSSTSQQQQQSVGFLFRPKEPPPPPPTAAAISVHHQQQQQKRLSNTHTKVMPKETVVGGSNKTQAIQITTTTPTNNYATKDVESKKSNDYDNVNDDAQDVDNKDNDDTNATNARTNDNVNDDDNNKQHQEVASRNRKLSVNSSGLEEQKPPPFIRHDATNQRRRSSATTGSVTDTTLTNSKNSYQDRISTNIYETFDSFSPTVVVGSATITAAETTTLPPPPPIPTPSSSATPNKYTFGNTTTQPNRTVVRVAPFNKTTSEIHRLKITHTDNNDDDDDGKAFGARNSTNCGTSGQKKTSILINGDDCYSTVNVTNDTPLYQSSVVVADGSSIDPMLKVTSNTVTINVVSSSPRTPQEELIYKNNKINTLLSSRTGGSCSGSSTKAIIPIGSSYGSGVGGSSSVASSPSSDLVKTSNKRGRTLITFDYDKSPVPVSSSSPKDIPVVSTSSPGSEPNDDVFSHEEELVKILRNPVEAVRRNLVPHVCGKGEASASSSDQPKSTEVESSKSSSKRQRKRHKSNELTVPSPSMGRSSERNSFVGKLLEDPTLSHLADGLESDVVVKLIENSLKRLKDSRSSIDTSGTKDNEDMNRLINLSLQRIKEDRLKLESQMHEAEEQQEIQSNRGSISSGNSFSSANYEMFDFSDNNESDCYQSCSSEIADTDTPLTTRSKFYQMLVDATLAEIEISTNVDDDHHYESIRGNNGDPIYEEINDIPPPLPLSPPPLNDPELEKKAARSMFEGASKYDILSYLVDAKERGLVREESFEYNINNTSNPIIIEEENDTLSDLKQTSDMSSRISHLSVTSDSSEDTNSLTGSMVNDRLSVLSALRKGTSSEIERNDSGVGSETSKSSRSKYQNNPQTNSVLSKISPIHLCEDCDGPVETQVTDSGVMFAPLVCRKCGKKRAERKEIITEIVETEEKYGRDLTIILEEFCQPMLVAGLLTQEQLSAIFLNTEELLENNQTLAERMRDALDIALEQGDDDLLTVNIGKVFLDFTPMLHAFESYCVRQAGASLLLANLEKEKELLRIFLKVSQMENTVLRRMNLNSFLMVPVQRVTKYPLLLARLYKVTPPHLEGRDLLKQAQEKIELHLNHINQEAKDVPTKLWRRISSSSPNRRASCEIDMINIKLRKLAIDILEWNHDEVRFAMEGKLMYTQPTDSNWKKGRTIKLNPVNALLVTNGKPSVNYKAEKAMSGQLNFPKHTGIREASLLVVKEKCGRYTLIREPLYLDRCVVCSEADWDDYFELQEISSKDTFIFKAEDAVRTKQWYTQIQYHAQGMGAWRKRRNALANIMINGMLSRT